MDKQREEFEKFSVETMKFRIDDCNDPYVKGMNERDWKIWQAAQAAMQPEIDRLASDKDELNDLVEKQEQQLSAANQRIAELLDLVEVVERRNKQLEERIRVADAEEPVGWLIHELPETSGPLRYCSLKQLKQSYEKNGHKTTPLYLHAQIPAEVAPSSDIVPDRYCKQSKCANATTGCVGHCRLDELSKGLSVTYTCQLVKER